MTEQPTTTSSTPSCSTRELPDPRFVDDRYLAWLYDENPDGPAVQAEADEDGVRVAHYALVPQTYRNAAGPAPFLFSLNAVTQRGTQRKGYWSELGLRVFADATAQGKKLVIGVPNEKSTPGAVKYLDYRFLGPMPVKVVVPTGDRRRLRRTTPSTTPSWPAATFDELAATLDQHEAVNWTNSYGLEQLRWRLARPHGGYTVHVGDDARRRVHPFRPSDRSPWPWSSSSSPGGRGGWTSRCRPGPRSPPCAATTGPLRPSTPGSTPS